MLVTRGGELFTWGSGHSGKLGLGHMMDAHSPQRVHTLWGQSIKHVAAGGRGLARSPSAALGHAAVCPFLWWRQQGYTQGRKLLSLHVVCLHTGAMPPAPAAELPQSPCLCGSVEVCLSVLERCKLARGWCCGCRLLHGSCERGGEPVHMGRRRSAESGLRRRASPGHPAPRGLWQRTTRPASTPPQPT